MHAYRSLGEGFAGVQPNLGQVSSWPRKIYLLFWLTLIGLTGFAAFLLPRLLDSSHEQGYREIEGQGKPALGAQPTGDDVSTRFPVRPFQAESSTAEPTRQVFPVSEETPSAPSSRSPSLPQRDVLGKAPAQRAGRETVTSRVRVVQTSSVFETPLTTAKVLGTVKADAQVRWVRTVEPGWEEILLNDGRSVYMQSPSLHMGTGGERPAADGNSDNADTAALPATVESFLGFLYEGQVLRANTYLAAEVPPLEESDLGAWSPFVGSGSDARVDRMEPVAGEGSDWRSVLIIEQNQGARILTTWRWNSRQERWLLVNWE